MCLDTFLSSRNERQRKKFALFHNCVSYNIFQKLQIVTTIVQCPLHTELAHICLFGTTSVLFVMHWLAAKMPNVT